MSACSEVITGANLTSRGSHLDVVELVVRDLLDARRAVEPHEQRADQQEPGADEDGVAHPRRERLPCRVGERAAAWYPLRERGRDGGRFTRLAGDVGREAAQVGVDVVAVTDVERAAEHGDAERGAQLARGVVDGR